jgi:hypothetical protein
MIDRSFPRLLAALFLGTSMLSTARAGAPREDIASKDVLKGFAAPPKNCYPVPLLTWDERLTEEQVRNALRALGAQKVSQVVIESPAKSPAWKSALDEARSLGISVWIHQPRANPLPATPDPGTPLAGILAVPAADAPDPMALYAGMARPAIDVSMAEPRRVREVSSVANQLQLRRVLGGALGGGTLRFEDLKRNADWLYVLGVNGPIERISASFAAQPPSLEAYSAHAMYAARLAAVLSRGEQVQQFLILEPATTLRLHEGDPSKADRMKEIRASFDRLVQALEMAQVEFDLGSEELIARNGGVQTRRLKIGKRGYRAVVIPPLVETLNSKTMDFLDELTLSGGTAAFCGEFPPLVDGRPPKETRDGAPQGWDQVEPAKVPDYLRGLTSDGFNIRRAAGDKGTLYHHRRKLADGEVLFLVNSSDKEPSSGVVVSPAQGAERWDLETGKAQPVAFEIENGGVNLPFELPPSGSLLVFLSWEQRDPAPAGSPVK